MKTYKVYLPTVNISYDAWKYKFRINWKISQTIEKRKTWNNNKADNFILLKPFYSHYYHYFQRDKRTDIIDPLNNVITNQGTTKSHPTQHNTPITWKKMIYNKQVKRFSILNLITPLFKQSSCLTNKVIMIFHCTPKTTFLRHYYH